MLSATPPGSCQRRQEANERPVFRRACHVDQRQQIAKTSTEHRQGRRPTGLLPREQVHRPVVSRSTATSRPGRPKRLLANAGTKWARRLLPEQGRLEIDLEIIVPSGRTDWKASIQSIAQSARKDRDQDPHCLPVRQRRTDKIPKGKLTSPSLPTPEAKPRGRTTMDVPPADPGRAERGKRWAIQEHEALEPRPALARRGEQHHRMKNVISQHPDDPLQDSRAQPLCTTAGVAGSNAVWTNWPRRDRQPAQRPSALARTGHGRAALLTE